MTELWPPLVTVLLSSTDEKSLGDKQSGEYHASTGGRSFS